MNLLTSLHAYSDVALLTLRLALFAVFWKHGRSKAKSWKPADPPVPPSPMHSLTKALAVCEPLAALSCLTGLLTQLAAVGMIVLMLGVIYMKTQVWKVPFSAHDKTGWELDLLTLAGAVVLLIMGSGAYGLDRLLLHI